MAAGDRYKNGKPKDVVRHMNGNNRVVVPEGTFRTLVWDGKTFCGRLGVDYSTNNWNDVTCLKCLKHKT